jgi:ribosomal RNA-processing protein 36
MPDPDELAGGSSSQHSSSDEDSSGSSGSESDEELTLEQQVADIPLELLEQLKSDGKGLSGEAARKAAKEAAKKKYKRPSKNAPQELTSKRPVSRFREVVQIPSK